MRLACRHCKAAGAPGAHRPAALNPVACFADLAVVEDRNITLGRALIPLDQADRSPGPPTIDDGFKWASGLVVSVAISSILPRTSPAISLKEATNGRGGSSSPSSLYPPRHDPQRFPIVEPPHRPRGILSANPRIPHERPLAPAPRLNVVNERNFILTGIYPRLRHVVHVVDLLSDYENRQRPSGQSRVLRITLPS